MSEQVNSICFMEGNEALTCSMVFLLGVDFFGTADTELEDALGFSGELSMICDTDEATKGAFFTFLATFAGALALDKVVCYGHIRACWLPAWFLYSRTLKRVSNKF